MGNTSIQWTDETWNPLAGCSIVSPGCTNCYAMKMAHRIEGMNEALGRATHYAGLTKKTKAGAVWTGKMAVAPEHILALPLRWKKPRRIFVNSMSDLFHEDVADELIDKVFAVMALAPQHTFQILTKRAGRMRSYFEERWQGTPAQRFKVGDTLIDMPAGGETGREHQVEIAVEAVLEGFPKMTDTDNDALWTEAGSLKIRQYKWPLPNVWLGVSVEDPERKYRIDDLRQTPAAIRFLSLEPLLEDLGELNLDGIHQVIVGGESGPRSRSFMLSWAAALVAQCRDAGVACFVKQLGANAYDDRSYVGSSPRYETKDKKGGDMAEWPADLRIREFPT